MTASCPLCDGPVEWPELKVVASRAICAGGTVPLGPVQAMILRVLLETGRPVGIQELARRVYWNGGPDDAVACLRAHVSKLKRLLAPLGWSIVNMGGTYSGAFYALSRLDAEADAP